MKTILRAPKLRAKKGSTWTPWQNPVSAPLPYTFFCCDCGLAHQMQFRVVEAGRKPHPKGHRVQFCIRRADKYTQAHRRARLRGRNSFFTALKKGQGIAATRNGVIVITLANGLRQDPKKISRRFKSKRKTK